MDTVNVKVIKTYSINLIKSTKFKVRDSCLGILNLNMKIVDRKLFSKLKHFMTMKQLLLAINQAQVDASEWLEH